MLLMQIKILPLALTGLAESLDKRLPQYQCGRCGQPDCAHYAQALAARQETPDRCVPGGRALAEQLAAVSGMPLSPGAAFDEGALQCAIVVEEACIGCVRCLRVCPLDALIGAPKRLHAVLPTLCTGCGLCLPACPVDCIVLEPADREWTSDDATAARNRYHARLKRLAEAEPVMLRRIEQTPASSEAEPREKTVPAETRQQVIAEALATARLRRTQYQARRQTRHSNGEG
ncbi:MAG: RnfABCDGE type electron transport complex subunit B [Burkholderiales bacterium]|jgi:electron transport complex protein RnfB|nr:RnfABCDGE type electron transport complex subunit B [Burkholderiales bacterium]